MGITYSCKCAKDAEKNEVDLYKDREEQKINNKNKNKENSNKHTLSTDWKMTNISNIQNKSIQMMSKWDKEHTTSDSAIAENVKNKAGLSKINNMIIDYPDDNYGPSSVKNPGHRNKSSQELCIDIDEHNLSCEIKNEKPVQAENKYSSSKGLMQPLQLVNEMFQNLAIENPIDPINYTSNIIFEYNTEKDNKNEISLNTFEYVSNNQAKELCNYASNIPRNSVISSGMDLEIIQTKRKKDSFKGKKLQFTKFRPSITSIIPEHKLLTCGKDEVLFQGELKKLISNEITTYSTQLYSSRFCIITKTEFVYYKSTEQYITGQRPLSSIPLFHIQEADLVKSKSSDEDHLIIKLKEISKLDTYSTNHRSSRIYSLDFDKNHDSSIHKPRKMSLIESKLKSSRRSKVLDSAIQSMNQDNTLIFKTEKEETLTKWIVVINYFLTN